MTREIKYRGRTKDKKWVFGYPYKESEGFYIVNAYDKIPVEEDTIGQFIGKKDTGNQKEIYEGDVVEIVEDGIAKIFIISWDEEELDFKATNGKKEYQGNYTYLGCCEEVNVIGNIFDNPQLQENIQAQEELEFDRC